MYQPHTSATEHVVWRVDREGMTMRTQMLGRISIDRSRVQDELELGRDFHYAEQYPEFQSGQPWKTCMIWSCGGEVGDGVIAHYDTSLPAQPTVYGKQLPYLRRLIEESVVVEHLRFARLVVMTDAVLLPHRDFLEFTDKPTAARAAHRLHVPLTTDETCLFMEDGTVYRMFPGELWSLDVSRMHSAAVLSDIRRVHLIMDFADLPDHALLRIERNPVQGIPEPNLVHRPKLTDEQRTAIRALAGVVDLENLNEVFGIVIRKSYRADGGERFAWDAMSEIARDAEDPAVGARIEELYKVCALERNE
ncbi:aspartyl beta-hydroxylase [Actinomadura syzygii]|uniref:Aspartyl beta-hydroxylase n=2 Tax=Actinomadura syzygii TaxID=1427538 RepID=A0A5D0TVY8_9ACTN|nr:aspartyl beta-hydroxylase [Actinomadura syzygii]